MTADGKLHEIKVKITTENFCTREVLDEFRDNLEHFFFDDIVYYEITTKLIKDKRKKSDPPSICKKCKWYLNKQCWYEYTLYKDFEGDPEVCFTPFEGDEQEIIDNYYEQLDDEIGNNKSKKGFWKKVRNMFSL